MGRQRNGTVDKPGGETQYKIILAQLSLVMILIPAMRYAFRHGIITQVDIEHFIGQFGVLAVPGFIILLAVGLLIFAPPPLLVGSGAIVFGSNAGAVYSWAGVIGGTCGAFLLGRYVATDFVRKRKQGRLRKINEWLSYNGIAFTFSSRLMFFANPSFNYAASMTSVTFKDYAVGSAIGVMPGVFILSHLFHTVVHARTLLDIVKHPAFIAMWVVRLGGVGLFKFLTHRYKGRSPEPNELPGESYECS